MALSVDQRLNGRKVVAVACFDSFGKTPRLNSYSFLRHFFH